MAGPAYAAFLLSGVAESERVAAFVFPEPDRRLSLAVAPGVAHDGTIVPINAAFGPAPLSGDQGGTIMPIGQWARLTAEIGAIVPVDRRLHE
ncbi:hypothetical protein GCM10009811_04000 [Nostocoides veronense]|uniref:Uncharacterized protein n=1 Tax=Nostocoides veronense TaxID=330836 RepID=A0ABN2LAM5_9MICO